MIYFFQLLNLAKWSAEEAIAIAIAIVEFQHGLEGLQGKNPTILIYLEK